MNCLNVMGLETLCSRISSVIDASNGSWMAFKVWLMILDEGGEPTPAGENIVNFKLLLFFLPIFESIL